MYVAPLACPLSPSRSFSFFVWPSCHKWSFTILKTQVLPAAINSVQRARARLTVIIHPKSNQLSFQPQSNPTIQHFLYLIVSIPGHNTRIQRLSQRDSSSQSSYINSHAVSKFHQARGQEHPWAGNTLTQSNQLSCAFQPQSNTFLPFTIKCMS